MDLLCPECRSPLQLSSPRTAACAAHNAHYEVLFDRHAEPAPVPEPRPQIDAPCAVHPRQKAVAGCAACQKPICALCVFDLNRERYCSDCAATEASNQHRQMETGGLVTLDLSSAPSGGWRRREVEMPPCADHPDNVSVSYCRLCAKPVCETCDFALPGGVHLCPHCVENAQSEDVSPQRKRLSYFGLGLAIWGTIMIVMMFSGAFNELLTDDESGKIADIVLTNITLWPLLIGSAVSMSATDRHLKSTGVMKTAVWWNGVLSAFFLVFIILANFGVFG